MLTAELMECRPMTRPKSVEGLFVGRHFDQEVIILCVRWYLRFKLSLRDLVEMMSERGLSLAHATIMRWVQRWTCFGKVESCFKSGGLPLVSGGADEIQ
jgi:hypothetical protein